MMMPVSKKTLVLGASDNPERSSYLAICKLRTHGHPVIAIGKREMMVGDVAVQLQTGPIPDLHTVTIYLNPVNQSVYYDYIISQHPHRVIFNPGAENPAFEKILQAKGIQTIEACSLVLLGTSQF